MKLVFAGMPGVGKGTIAARLEKDFNLKHISTGELLRDEVKRATKLGRKVKNILQAGNLVSDDLIVALVEHNISALKSGFILDGFPRTLYQVERLERIAELDKVVSLEAEDSILLGRLMARGKNSKNKVQLRNDDNKQVILERFRIFRLNTFPILSYYKKRGLLVQVNAAPEIEEVYSSVKKALHLSRHS